MPKFINSKFNGDFNLIGDCLEDIEYIEKIIFSKLDHFTLTNRNLNNTNNILRDYRVHDNTNHLTFFFEDNTASPKEIISYNNNIFLLLKKNVNNIITLIQKYYKNNSLIIARCLITCLKPFTNIPIHRDSGYILELGHRIHIPIKTNNNVLFNVGNTQKNLEKGKIYEINNCRRHWVNNNSKEPRYHLIIDLINPELLKKNLKL